MFRQGRPKHPQQEFLQVDTTNILFICGGAFVGLEDIIESRIGQRQMGFGANIQSKRERKVWEYLKEVQPEDLLKYGLIPEFIGRLPVVIAPLHELSEEAMIDILTKPRNALIKQYQKLFEMDGGKLRFTKRTQGHRAVGPKSQAGARGLRSIVETLLLDTMFEIPSRPNIKEVLVNEEVIEQQQQPLIYHQRDATESVTPAK